MTAAEDAGLPYHVGLIEAFNLCRSLGTTIENLLAQVRVFADYADKTSGMFRLERFAQILDLSLTREEMAEFLALAGVTVSIFVYKKNQLCICRLLKETPGYSNKSIP